MYRLLIVDDEQLIRKGLTRIVEINHNGFMVVGEAANGKEGYEMAAKLDPHLVIVDIEMPNMDGLEMIDKIKVINPRCYFIILSAHTDYGYMRRAIKSDVVDYLQKPVDRLEFWDLLERISKDLDNKRYNGVLNDSKDYAGGQGESGVKIVQKGKEYMDKHFYEDISLERVAEYLVINPNYFSTLFKNETGENFIDYITRLRIERSKDLLRDMELKIYEISEMVGYYSPKYFSNTFKKLVGMTPTEYRQRVIWSYEDFK